MIRLMLRFMRYNFSAHLSNLPNLLAGGIGMVVNNTIFLTGIWGMLFAGKPGNHHLLYYYLALNALVMTAWGMINFFCGGWIDLGEMIVSGQFESKLATPRHPLALVAIHALHPSAVGDLVMGLIGIVILAIFGPDGMAIRTVIATFITILALFALYIFSGSLAFFIPRGNAVALLIRELTLSLSVYPMAKIFPSGLGRWILLLTPAGTVSLLPMDWIESGSFFHFAGASLALIPAFGIAFLVYTLGVKRFQSVSLVGIQN